MTKHWHTNTDSDGILWLGLDYADGPVNLLSREVLDELDSQIEAITASPPGALILHSMKAKGFIAGADVNEFTRFSDPGQIERHLRHVHGILDRFERLPCPTLALVRGFCLGGGMELALACRYRIACDDRTTLLGLPEVKLGLFPGYGGTWRSIRIAGPTRAIQMMLSGRTLRPKQAMAQGLVDLIAPERQLQRSARRLLASPPKPARAPASARLLNMQPLRGLVSAGMRRQLRKRIHEAHYPAPFALIEHWRENGADRERLLESEARRVSELVGGDQARNLIRVFQLQERLKGLAGKVDWQPRRIHVIGAGAMGGDIAAWCALRGLQVSLQDLSLEQLGHAMRRAHALFERRLRDRRAVQAAWDRLLPDPNGDAIGGADLVLEAVVEDIEVKQRLLQGLEPKLAQDALIATNTSSIPLETLGEGLEQPGRLVGLHFFNPVAKMQLVEVIHSDETSAQTMDRALSLVRTIDRLPLPVRSSPGFLVNRVLMPYLLEAIDLLDEGVPAAAIDRAAVAFGMPMGPIALADAVGLDICLSVAEKLGRRLSAPEQTPPGLRTMVEQGRLGQKTGRGFYQYRGGKPRIPRLGFGYQPPPDLAERMIFRLLNESVACLREGVVADADLLDAGVIFGTGFAPFRGGPMHYIGDGGWAQMLHQLESLERHHGGHFHPDRGWSRLVGV